MLSATPARQVARPRQGGERPPRLPDGQAALKRLYLALISLDPPTIASSAGQAGGKVLGSFGPSSWAHLGARDASNRSD